MPRLWAVGVNQVWNWDITYLPTTVRGIWLYLYLVIDVWMNWATSGRSHGHGSQMTTLTRHRHSGIQFVTPVSATQRIAIAICKQRAEVYKNARRANPKRWSRYTRCWHQPKDVWITRHLRSPIPCCSYRWPSPPAWQPRSDTFPESHRSGGLHLA